MSDVEVTGRALEGVCVVELGALIAGPFAGRILADFGATVIKVENPSRPDPMREWGRSMKNGRSLWWAIQSRGKQLASMDLKSDAGLSKLRGLLDEADVLIENFRPGTLERLGLDPETLWETNPGLVITRVSGFGQDGPNKEKGGYASVAEAASGMRYLNGYPNQAPPRTGISLGDSLGALYAVQGILTALYWRDARGGKGQIVDVSLVDSCFSMLESAVAEYVEDGIVPDPSGTRLDGIAPSNIYLAKDKKWVVIAANQDTVFRRLVECMGQPGLATDPRFADHRARGVRENQETLDDIISQWAAGMTAAELQHALDAAGVPVSKVNSIADIFEDEHFRARDLIVPVGEPDDLVHHPGIVPKLTATPGEIRWNGATGMGTPTPAFVGEGVGNDD